MKWISAINTPIIKQIGKADNIFHNNTFLQIYFKVLVVN